MITRLRKLNRVIWITGVLALVWFGLHSVPKTQAATGIPYQLSYQGKLNDSNGVQIADGTYSLKFVIYDSLSGGSCLWTASGACDTADYKAISVTTVNGVFSVSLGEASQNSLATSTINWNTDSLYLGVTVESDLEMTPRKQLTSSVYAINSDMLDGLHATSTASVANYLLTLDSFGNLNLYDKGVSSTRATTSEFVLVGTDGNITHLDRNGGDLYVAGDFEVDGTTYFQGTVINSTNPTLAHAFGVWAPGVGGSNVDNSSLYINPSSAVSDSNLLGLAVGGSVKFLVDAEGDVFANNLTIAGSQSVGQSTISTLFVENNSYLGDASNADWTHIKGSVWIESNKSGVPSSTALVITQQGTGNYLEVSDNSTYYQANRYFTITNTGVASTTELFVVKSATTTANLYVAGFASTTDLIVGTNPGRTSTSTTVYGGMIVDGTTLVVNANEDRVGIGTSNPSALLDVNNGNIAISQGYGISGIGGLLLEYEDSLDTIIRSPFGNTSRVDIEASGNLLFYADSDGNQGDRSIAFIIGGNHLGGGLNMFAITTTTISFNANNRDTDFQVGTLSSENSLFVQGSNGSVGIADF